MTNAGSGMKEESPWGAYGIIATVAVAAGGLIGSLSPSANGFLGAFLLALATAVGIYAGERIRRRMACSGEVPHSEDLEIGDCLGHWRIIEIVRHPEPSNERAGIARVTDGRRIGFLKFIRSSDPGMREQPSVVRRLINEARLADTLSSSRLAVYLDADNHRYPPWVFLVTGWFEGETLSELVERRDQDLPKQDEELIQVAYGAALGLARMHEGEVSHGDVRPENIMVNRQLFTIVVDYSAAYESGQTHLPEPAASPFFAPERMHTRKTSAVSDLFALGVCLFYAATGMSDISDEGANARFQETPLWYQRLVIELVDENPDERPSASSVVETVLAQARDLQVALVEPPHVAPANPPSRKIWLRAFVLSSVAAWALAALVLYAPAIGERSVASPDSTVGSSGSDGETGSTTSSSEGGQSPDASTTTVESPSGVSEETPSVLSPTDISIAYSIDIADPLDKPWVMSAQPTGPLVIGGAQSGEVLIWNSAEAKEICRVHLDDWAYGVDIDPSGTYFATSSSDGTARIWEIATCSVSQVLTHERYLVQDVGFSSDGESVVTISTADGQPRVSSWSLDGTLNASYDVTETPYVNGLLVLQEEVLVFDGEAGVVLTFDLRLNPTSAPIDVGRAGGFAVSSDERFIAGAHGDDGAWVRRRSDWSLIDALAAPAREVAFIRPDVIAVTPNPGQQLLVRDVVRDATFTTNHLEIGDLESVISPDSSQTVVSGDGGVVFLDIR